MNASDQQLREESLFRSLLLELGQERNLGRLLNLIVRRLEVMPAVALARVWLVRAGDVCASCRLASECPDQTTCLHLVASAGKSRDGKEDWSGLDGFFRRFPLGVRKVGHIAATGKSIELQNISQDSRWIARPRWVQKEQIRGLYGEPLAYRSEILGVLAVFTRDDPGSRHTASWMRIVADHAASAIANARAFEEIARLKAQLQLENEYLRDEVRTAQGYGNIVGQSPVLLKVLQQVELVAPTDTGVLITGETGTGKELIARAIHSRSRRAEGPLIKVNCASIPADLFESEFFGHMEGAFTGAVKDRAGRFELAHGGTIFLDEVGEIPVAMQGKLLRVLQEGTYERIGEARSRVADVRIVAATNRNLQGEIERRRFRQDLYYRLSVFPIELPPLRSRAEDIPLLAQHFLSLHGRRLGLREPRLTRRQARQLQDYTWPGNVRELGNVVERALIRARIGPLVFEVPAQEGRRDRSRVTAASSLSGGAGQLLTESQVRQLERDNLVAALEQTGWRISGPKGAARLIGLHPATLTSRLKAMGIKRRRP